MLPDPSLLDALRQFFDAMDDVSWRGAFVVNGQVL
jgi:hypothetical protein